MALGEAYFDANSTTPAAAALAKVPPHVLFAGRAQFLLGLCDLYLGQPDKAEPTLADLSTRVPLPEVYNNLGVARARLGKPTALDPLQKAADTDPADPDYQFNLARALFRKGDATGSTREIRALLAANPNDAEAKSLLEALVAASDPKYAPVPIRLRFRLNGSSGPTMKILFARLPRKFRLPTSSAWPPAIPILTRSSM